jgi:opacity protein-like surface antigen
MKKIIIAVFALALFTSQSLKAEGFYMGLDYLNTKIDIITNIDSRYDDSDKGYSIYAGMPINENLDIEISYQDFGEASVSGGDGDRFVYRGQTLEFLTAATITASADSFGIAAKPKYKINENLNVYAKLGLHRWDAELAAASSTASGSESTTGTDIFYGVGIQGEFNNLSVRAGYSIYDVDGIDIDAINVGVAYKF